MNANTKMDININRQVHYYIIYKLLICFYPWKNGGIYDQIGEQEQKWYHCKNISSAEAVFKLIRLYNNICMLSIVELVCSTKVLIHSKL